MINTLLTPLGVRFTGSKQLLKALPAGTLIRLKNHFNRSYAQIHTQISGIRYSDARVVECASEIVAYHKRVKYDENINAILNNYPRYEKRNKAKAAS